MPTSDEMKKYVELIEKTKANISSKNYAKIMIKLSSFDDCVHHYNVKILNHFGPESQLINIKLIKKKKSKDLLGE